MLRILLLWAPGIALALHAPPPIHDQDGSAPRLDRFGDPLPVGAVTRLGTLRFHRSSCAAYSPDGKIIATADRGELNLWNVATSRKVRQLSLEDSAVGLIFSHDGKKLAAIGWGGTSIQVFDLNTFKKVLLTQVEGGRGGGDWSNAAAFSSDDKTICAATSRDLFVWDLASGNKLKQFPLQVMGKPIDVRLLALAEDGQVAATQGDKQLHLWDMQTGKLLHEIDLLSSGDTMKFSRDGKLLAVPGWGHWLPIFSVATGKKIHSLPVSERVVSVAFSSDGKTLAAGSNGTTSSSSTEGDQVIQLWDLAKLPSPPVRFPAPGVHFVSFSPDGKTLAWGCHEQTLCFMDPITGEDQQPTASHRGAIKSLLYFPDGKRIVSASEDGTIRIWDAATGESLNVWHGHVCAILGLALFPNGKLLASCGRDGTFRLWDIDRGKSITVWKDEGNAVAAIGRMIADPERALAFLERRLHSVPKVDAKHVQRLIDDLDSNQANRREAAAQDLTELATLVEPALQAALSAEEVPLVAKKRIKQLLQDLDEKQTTISAQDVLHVRAMQALERMGTKRARQLLENLARGAETSPRTRAAVESLSRMEAR